jgi:hypothetical protein
MISSVTFPVLQAEVSSCPHVLPPVVLLDVREFQHDLVGRLPLQPLQQPADRYLWWDRHQQMHVIFRHVPFHDLHIVSPADLPDQIPHSRRPTSPTSTCFRYLVVHTTCKWISYTVCAPRRYSVILQAYSAALLAEAVA